MDDISGNNPGLRSNLARWTILSVAALFAAFSFYQIFSYTFVSFVVIAVSSIVASLIGKYEMSVPGTEIKFRPKVVLAFWGAMWLGVGGAAILGSLASASKKESASKYTMNDALRIAPDTIAAFLGALAFQVSLIYYAGSKPAAIGGFNIPNEVVAASFLMAITHFAVSLALAAIINTTTDVEHRVKDLPVQQIAKGYFTTLSATIVLFLVFNHFGIEFGLVILPLVIFADIAFKIHIRSLELKTRQISEASRVHMATVEALATAIDARDQVGIGHVRRTQIYAVGIGNVMGLSDDEINALRTGALLHDIGKLAVPDHILNKPGRLTPGEMEKTKIHSSVGASILEKVGFPYPVVPIVKYHHECWDGSGYPEGLRGNNIPITARILAIADTFDTLRGARPYRHAVPRDEACDFLRSRAGSQFDPTIVDLFLRNLRIFENEIDAQGLTYEKTIEGPAVGSIVLDESATPNYVEQIKRANHEVFTLYSLARDFSGSLNLDETLSLFTRKIAEFIPFDTSVVYLLDESGETATAAYAHGLNRSVLSNKQIKLGEGATGYALKKLRPVENVDPALDFAFSDTEIGRDYSAMLSLPILADEKLIGAVSLYSCELSNYQDEHVRLLDTVSRIAADAIEKALKHAEAQIYALTDPMTGLPNSRSLQIEFDKEVTRASRTDSSFQLLVLDLDGFKSVNDTYGHKTGDNMLKEVGRVIREQLREYDFLSRYGGDEFVAIIPETNLADIKRLKRRIVEAVSNFVMPVNDEAFAGVGISLGSASYPSQGETFDELIVAADKAMYLTKAINRQRKLVTIPAEIQAGLQPPGESSSTTIDAIIDPIEVTATHDRKNGSDQIADAEELRMIASSAIN